MKNRTVVVTGVAGFIAGKLSERLIANGWHVIGIDDLSSGHQSRIPRQVDFIQCDLSDTQEMAKLAGRFTVEAVCHLAGQSSGERSFEDPHNDLARNTISTLNLLTLAESWKAKRFIFASSMAVYGAYRGQRFSEISPVEPLSFYGAHKLASEKLLGLPHHPFATTSLRMFNVFGTGQDLDNLKQGMVSIFVAQAKATGRLSVRGPVTRVRDFIDVADVAYIWERILESSNPPKLMNVGSGMGLSVGFVIELLSRYANTVGTSIEAGTPGDQDEVVADISLLSKTLPDFSPQDPVESLRDYFAREFGPS